MNMGADGQAVAVPFGHAVRFEGRPVFAGADGSFTCPDSNRGGNRNENCSRNLLRLCRMMRARKDRMTVPVGGLPFDTLDCPDERPASGSPPCCRRAIACTGAAVRRRNGTEGEARRAANRGDCGTAARAEARSRSKFRTALVCLPINKVKLGGPAGLAAAPLRYEPAGSLPESPSRLPSSGRAWGWRCARPSRP